MSNNAMPGGGSTDREPLLGRPGDAVQQPEGGLLHNLVLGTASVAQAGIWIVRTPLLLVDRSASNKDV